MFGKITMLCKACNMEKEADLCVHGPGVCVIAFSCGHEMTAIGGKTSWLNKNTGKIDLEESSDEESCSSL